MILHACHKFVCAASSLEERQSKFVVFHNAFRCRSFSKILRFTESVEIQFILLLNFCWIFQAEMRVTLDTDGQQNCTTFCNVLASFFFLCFKIRKPLKIMHSINFLKLIRSSQHCVDSIANFVTFCFHKFKNLILVSFYLVLSVKL